MEHIVLYIPEKSWQHFLEEGDVTEGIEWSGLTHAHCLSTKPKRIEKGSYVYFAALGEIQFRAPIYATAEQNGKFFLLRQGGAEDVLVDIPIRPFQGFRYKWWPDHQEAVY